ncbi:MAG: HAD family phosphatase [Flavobacteriaceae bacterium]|nr:HAD family phosphatase [Flavobacteriaceae bacterium]
MKRAVLFDMDGVICHTNPFHAKAFDAFFEKRGMAPSTEDYAAHMYGKSNSYIFSHFLGRKIQGDELLKLEAEKEGLFREIYANHVNPISGYLNFLEELKAHNFETAVATSAPRANMDLIIDHLNIRTHMGSMMGSEDVVEHKPAPEVYLNSANNLKVPISQCIVFEDSYSGVTAALNANMKVVGVLSSHTKKELPPCDLYIENYTQITAKDLLEQLSITI